MKILMLEWKSFGNEDIIEAFKNLGHTVKTIPFSNKEVHHDTEIENKPYADRVACLREAVIRNRPAFFINTGDLCIKDGLERHYLLMNRETMGCPVRYAIGNHDFTAEGAYGEALYEKFYGPTWYSFDCGDIHFAVLSIGKGDKPSGYQLDDQ